MHNVFILRKKKLVDLKKKFMNTYIHAKLFNFCRYNLNNIIAFTKCPMNWKKNDEKLMKLEKSDTQFFLYLNVSLNSINNFFGNIPNLA